MVGLLAGIVAAILLGSLAKKHGKSIWKWGAVGFLLGIFSILLSVLISIGLDYLFVGQVQPERLTVNPAFLIIPLLAMGTWYSVRVIKRS